MNKTINILDLENECRELAANIIDDAKSRSDDIYDILHEILASHQWVIYYHDAWEVVGAARSWSDVYDAAYDLLIEMEGNIFRKDESFDQLITRFAFCIMYTITEDLINNIREAA